MKVKNGEVNVPLKVIADDGMLKNIKSPYDKLHVWFTVYEKDSVILSFRSNLTLGMIKSREQLLPAKFRVQLHPGKYSGRFSITSCIPIWPTINSTVLNFHVK